MRLCSSYFSHFGEGEALAKAIYINIMRAKHISDVNEAILVLRHFVELSAKLLPFLDELERKKTPTSFDLRSRDKIIAVYENYEFDTNTSKVLMNSDVLDLIKKSFETISQRSHASRTKRANRNTCYLRRFLAEHDRLQQSWGLIQAN
ncbi:MAG: hypothetical protein Crog4KO_04260 [Crocinitomicaceae bacterium]